MVKWNRSNKPKKDHPWNMGALYICPACKNKSLKTIGHMRFDSLVTTSYCTKVGCSYQTTKKEV